MNKPTAIVTGVSRGLGKALAEGLTDAGWTVIGDGRTLTARQRGHVPGDITDSWHRGLLVETALETGRLDLLVNNAGILGPSPQPFLADYPDAELRRVFEVNVVAPLALTQLALPALRDHGGAVVNISSDAATGAYPGWGGYGAAKAAVEQLSNVLAAEEPKLRVWWVDPGDLRTQMHQEAFPGEDIGDRPLPESVVPALLDLLATRPASGRIKL
ncbi:SDR family NAD(P)-dependent oxidoreductase [Dactylosporangium matsuzakiense]|uniref:Short-chain dehydrogenase n=1 Tax=Dactylosporangium matsuzakiense TaxID=53360 RepID=A0A9W6KJ99_9ACTN|nr:SDR family oxidoreductase [Dactylosporangium matsuzakiense]UWZ46604.1 SDR family oxidoreductase [Dactylosporangium matsuzakiense]GLL01266.1 short-chain dehydrogenase [Dactylosporangium matsuzakiense]